MHKPVLLVILDGFGIAPKTKYNAIAQANTPNLDQWMAHRPHAILGASGEAVGLPEGYIGNSEVGHMTMGAGRVIEQPASFLLQAIESGEFFTNSILQESLQQLKQNNRPVHIIGLLSDGGVHCHEKVIYAFIKAAADAGIQKIFVHPILDGRDVAPKSAAVYLERLENLLKEAYPTSPRLRRVDASIHIGSVHGRFYAMDRDNNWERTQKSYEILTSEHGSMILARKARRLLTTNGKNNTQDIHEDDSLPFALSSERASRPEYRRVAPVSWQQVLSENYSQNITDEFIPPTNLDPEAIITAGDGVIFANYRPDRARQLTECFLEKNFTHFSRKNMKLEFFITPVSYGTKLDTKVMYPHEPVTNTLKEILSEHHKTIFSIAETEKYAHITYFFDGGRETIFPGETRVHIPSIRAHDYIHNPQMSAPEITQAVINSLRTNPCDFYLINYANADMVGHSGNFEATKKAIEILDKELGKLYDVAVNQMHGTMFVTADHGKAEEEFDVKSSQPCTAHTTNPVPFIMLNDDNKNGAVELPLHQLADIMGFVLGKMGLEK